MKRISSRTSCMRVLKSIRINQEVQRFMVVEGVMEKVIERVFGRTSGNVIVEGSLIGDVSFEEMSMMFVRATFLGGFLVKDEALEAILKVD
ncbi:hypothetical protein Tco_0770863 [Tanacetum coccineum]|uniref:Uncharacterized protein n=1 Tax=Tanacetum coccineum TaxID=301880 RepID=A0ABQ4ZGX8_9ASTR